MSVMAVDKEYSISKGTVVIESEVIAKIAGYPMP